MRNFNAALTQVPSTHRADFYLRCAEQVLVEYDLAGLTPHFVQHNAGVVFRLADESKAPQAMLKIHENAGDSGNDTPEQIAAQMLWLASLNERTGIPVQSPLKNRAGQWVTQVQFDGVERSAACTVQRWIEGEHARQWTTDHAAAIGALLATIHQHSEQWPPPVNLQLGRCGAAEIAEAFATVCSTTQYGLIDAEQRALIAAVGERCCALLELAAETPAVWGIVHGDLHQGNVFFVDHKPAPIDFNAFFAHYLYDLGVSLYHASYDEVAIRQSLVAGYRRVRPLLPADHDALPAYMIMAAANNLAFQALLPNHRLSPINQRNMEQFAEKFCRPFLANEPFLFDGRSLTIGR